MGNVTIDDLQKYVDKEAVVHLVNTDGTLREVTGKIKAATVAGVAFQPKGKPLELIDSVDKIEEIDFAPTKAKAVTVRKMKPIEFGNARQHLVDRHGVQLSWAKEASEKDAFDYHETLDHSNLGHVHVAEDKQKDEREKALETPQAPAENPELAAVSTTAPSEY